MFVGRNYTSDVRPSYFNLLNIELCKEWMTLGMGWNSHNSWRRVATEAGAIGEQQLKWTQLGSSS